MHGDKKTNIVLIGMPGAGKTTIGRELATQLDIAFIDTDTLIEAQQNRSLQNIVDSDGFMPLREAEAATILALNAQNTVIATGGSAVYSTPAIEHLRSHGLVIFLDLPLSDIEARIDNFSSRGLARQKNQSLESLYNERYPYYLSSCDHKLACSGLSVGIICAMITELSGRK